MSKNTHHFGSDWKTLEKDICDSKADIIGITNLFRENTEETIKTIKIARKALPNSVIVVGGPNATAMPEYILERAPELDIVGLGDGEKTMMAIVKWNQGKGSLKDIKGIIYREDNKLIHTPEREWVTQLDELGKIITFFVLEIILLSRLMNINPFDQPAVEEVKIETKRFLR